MKILYGLAGEGSGHAIRSKPILEHLSKKHEVLVVGGGRAWDILSKDYNMEEIGCYFIKYKDNAVRNWATFFYNVFRLPRVLLKNMKLFRIMREFKPDVVISDFEPFVSYMAMFFRKRCISIDNQHIMTNTKIDVKGDMIFRLLNKVLIKSYIVGVDTYLVTTFFYPKVKGKKTSLFPPINREEIIKTKPGKGKHILVYQTSKSYYDTLMNILGKVDEKFIVYGYDKDKKLGNVQLKKFSEKQFIKDMASCKAFITNGGFTTLGEALYLQKPILSVPIKKQYEQMLNAIYLQRLGYGKYVKELSVENLNEFISEIKFYSKNLKGYKREDNRKILKKLDKLI